VPFAAKTVLKGLMEAEGGGGSGWGL
jgi:hypothetical protein